MRLVLDTNVIVAGLVSEGLCHEIVEILSPRQFIERLVRGR